MLFTLFCAELYYQISMETLGTLQRLLNQHLRLLEHFSTSNITHNFTDKFTVNIAITLVAHDTKLLAQYECGHNLLSLK